MYIKSVFIILLLILPAGGTDLHRADVNNDGRIDELDLVDVRNSMHLAPDDPRAFYSDVTGDAAVNLLDLVAVRNELNTRRQQREFLFDLGPANAPLADGAVRITEDTTYDEQLGFGWKTPLTDTRTSTDRSWDDPLRSDLIMADEPMTFIVRLPAGTYDIYVDHAYTETLATSMHFAIKGGRVFGATPGWTLYGSAMLENRPTADENARYFLAVAVEEDGLVEITFFGHRESPYTGPWGVSYIEVRQAPTHLILHDVHLEPDKGYDMTVPTRDSNLSFVSNTFGDYQQDWDYLVEWYQDVVDDTMTTDEKVRAIVQKMFDTLALAGTNNFHPVDVLIGGRADCARRAYTFQGLMHTLGLPARGIWLKFMPESRFRGMYLYSYDPLWYTYLFHFISEVYYDGKWHTYNTNYGALYDCSIVELAADPTIQPVMFQPSRQMDSFFFFELKDMIFMMDMNKGRTGGNADRMQYTPQTARTIYADKLDSYPFRLQAHRPAFDRHERVLPIVRFYFHDIHHRIFTLESGNFVRQRILLSNLDGIKRLSNQINIIKPENTSQIRLLMRVNGHEFERTVEMVPGSDLFAPILLSVPSEYLTQGYNNIDVEPVEPATLQIYYFLAYQDLYLHFPTPQTAPADAPEQLASLPLHLYWNVDAVYELEPLRFSSGSVQTNTLSLGSVQHSLLMLPHVNPEAITGASNLLDTFSFENSSYIEGIFSIRSIPPFLKIAADRQE